MSSVPVVVDTTVPYRTCPNCRQKVPGFQEGQNSNWHRFSCSPCTEEWFEDTKYCFPEEINPLVTQ